MSHAASLGLQMTGYSAGVGRIAAGLLMMVT